MSNERTYPPYDITFKGVGKLIDSQGREVDDIPHVDGTHLFLLKTGNTKLRVDLKHNGKNDEFPMLTISFTDMP